MSDPKTRRQVLFYAEAEAGMYDSTIELVVPQYRVLHECLLELLGVAFRASGNPEGQGLVVDIGSGTGAEALGLLRRFDGTRLIAIDLCAPMHSVLKRKLREERLESRCVPVLADFLSDDCEPSRLLQLARGEFGDMELKTHLVVSAFALHHLAVEEKKVAYSRIHELLVPGGLFLCADLFSFHTLDLAVAAHEFDMAWIRHSFLAPKTLEAAREDPSEKHRDLAKRWKRHYDEDNILLPLTPQSAPGTEASLLEAAGFRAVEVPYRFWQTGIFWAGK